MRKYGTYCQYCQLSFSSEIEVLLGQARNLHSSAWLELENSGSGSSLQCRYWMLQSIPLYLYVHSTNTYLPIQVKYLHIDLCVKEMLFLFDLSLIFGGLHAQYVNQNSTTLDTLQYWYIKFLPTLWSGQKSRVSTVHVALPKWPIPVQQSKNRY